MRVRAGALLLALLLIIGLGACTPTLGVRQLHFQATDAGYPLQADTLLLAQRVPTAQLLSVHEAVRRAPLGSVIVACWQDTGWDNFWGPCSHITRKISDTELADTWPSKGANLYPLSLLYPRYAVIVLDVGARPEHLPAMRAMLDKLKGQPYDLSGSGETYYCSTLQNALNRAAGLPDVVPFNRGWNAYIPAEALLEPKVKVLWVGVQGQK